MAARARRPRRLSRRAKLLLLSTAVLAGLILVWVGPALADPSPAPGPAPTAPGGPSTPTTPPSPPGVPDPGLPPPGASRPPGTPPSNPAPSAPAPATPAPMPTPGVSNPSGSGDPAWWDITGQVRQAVADLVVWAAAQAIQPVMETLGESWLSTPNLTSNDAAKGIWGTSLLVANAVFVLFIVAGGFVVTARETLQTHYGLKEVLPRLAVGAVTANCSLIVLKRLIEWTNALTVAIAANSIDGPTAAAAIRQVVENVMSGNNFLLTLLVIAVVVMCLVVEVTFVLRIAALVILFGIAPVALMCHASPYTEGIAHTWWRAVAACLGLQLGQALVVMATVKVFLTPAGPTILGIPSSGDGLLRILVCLTMLWVLVKLPGWMRQFILGPLGQSGGRGLIGTIVHTYLMVKTLGAAAGVARSAGTAARATATAGRAGKVRPLQSARRPVGGRRPPRPGPRPSPAGPAAFSHAPVAHTPLAAPAGNNRAPTFSSAPPRTTASPSPSGAVPAARFSHLSPTEAPRPAPTGPAPRVAFSDASPTTPARADRRTPAPGATFSAAPAAHTAPRRPPAPVTPVFSNTPTAQPASGRGHAGSPARRPTAARRATPAPLPSGATTSTQPAPPNPAVPADEVNTHEPPKR